MWNIDNVNQYDELYTYPTKLIYYIPFEPLISSIL